MAGEQITDVLKLISGGITSLLVIASFIIMLVKPIRIRFTQWVTKQARTEVIIDRLDKIDTTISSVDKDVCEIRSQLEQHIEKNDMDFKSSQAAHMMSLRCQIREIYTRNYTTKHLTIREQRDIYDLYEAYSALGGNSYIKHMLEEMKDWEVSSKI